MKINGGFLQSLLRINLTDGTIKKEKIEEEMFAKYVGGALLADKILYDELKPHTDALGVDNKLIFFTGPLTGTDAICASRMGVATKSPLTGTICNSFSGGYMPVEIKYAGYDIIVIEGKSDEPVYISINNDNVKIKSAKQYWGINAIDTQVYMKEELKDQNYRIACIGPAGENLSLLSVIINEQRAMGRKGVGAVMGSKNLKAIAVRGTRKVPVADSAMLKKGIDMFAQCLKESPIAYSVFSHIGSSSGLSATQASGALPIKNFSATGTDEYESYIGGEALGEYKIRRNNCYRCPLGCAQVRMVQKGRYAGIATEGPEYETIYSFGSMLCIKDPAFIIAMDRLCDELGIDTISTGVTIAMAMELYEKGLLKDTDGLDLRWGNCEAVEQLVRKMAYREGLGGMLSDGSRKLGEKLGGDAPYYAMQIKGLELPAYDPRGLKAQGLNLATSYNGADHNRGYAFQEVFGMPIPYPVERLATKGKGILAKFNQDFCGTYDVATLCEFPTQLAMPHCAQEVVAIQLSGVSGIKFTADQVWTLGEKLNNITRMFNVREGFDRTDDTLPKRFITEAITDGLSKGETVSQQQLDEMLDEYYEARGWDKNGIPTESKLIELELI
ncbi:MAG: aldehyde ferredoxin oxidoreductase family protein [Sedimentibacter sp.]